MTLDSNRPRRRLALTVAVLALIVSALGPTALANASPTLTLSDTVQYGDRWIANGAGFAASMIGKAVNVQLWIEQVPNWSTLEYQDNITTSRSYWYNSGGVYTFVPGGQFTAEAALVYQPVSNPSTFGYPGYWSLEHPLACWNYYQAVAYDPSDGYVYSNLLRPESCPK